MQDLSLSIEDRVEQFGGLPLPRDKNSPETIHAIGELLL
jgi:hypothetical protein